MAKKFDRSAAKNGCTLRDAAVKVSNSQINQSVSILNTPNTHAKRTVVAVHVGVAAEEVQVAAVSPIHRSRPVIAVK